VSCARPRARREPGLTALARSLLASACVLALALLVLGQASGQARVPATERGVKAAFLYKFLAYAEWPAGTFTRSDQAIVVGVLGADELHAELAEAVRGHTVDDRTIEVRRLRPGDPVTALHVLFVGASERARVASLARAVQGRGVLLVTESDDALDAGSTINFVVVDGRVRFEVSLPGAERAGVKLSSRLLAVAQNVRMADK
jgi:hypothetical protein